MRSGRERGAVDQTPSDSVATESEAAKNKRRKAIIGVAVAVFVLLLVVFMTWRFLQRPATSDQTGLSAANNTGTPDGSQMGTLPPGSVVTSAPLGSADASPTIDASSTAPSTEAAQTAYPSDAGASTVPPAINPYADTVANPTPTPTPPSTTTKSKSTSNSGSTTVVKTKTTTVTYQHVRAVLSPSTPNGANNWYRTRPVLTFSPSGRTTWYRWKTSGSWTTYKHSVYAPDGEHTLQYYSREPNGTLEAKSTQHVAVDRTAPSKPTNLHITSASASGISLAWTKSSDSYSGVMHYEVCSGNNVLMYTSGASVALAANAGTTFQVRAVDFAGNKSVFSNQVQAPPTTLAVLSPPNPDGDNGWFKNAPMITLVSNESGTTYYAWDSQPGYTKYTSALTVPGDGDHTLRYYSVNASGLQETEKSREIKLDRIAPPAPPSVSAIASGTDVNLSWGAVADMVPGSGLAGYRVLDVVGGGEPTSYDVAPTVLTFTVTEPEGTSVSGHQFLVFAVDNAGHESGPSSYATPSASSSHSVAKLASSKGSIAKPAFAAETSGLTKTPMSSPPAAPAGFTAVPGTIVDISPPTGFAGSATITLTYDPALLNNSSAEVRLMHYHNGAWEDITTEVDAAGHRVIGVADSFSPFGVFEVPPTTVTPASSWQSLTVLALGGLLIAAWSLRRRRQEA